MSYTQTVRSKTQHRGYAVVVLDVDDERMAVFNYSERAAADEFNGGVPLMCGEIAERVADRFPSCGSVVVTPWVR